MATVWEVIGELLWGVGAFVSRNIIAIGLVIVAVTYIYFKYSKPKQINQIDVIFNREWEMTTQALKLPIPKKLLITAWPMSAEDLVKVPIYQIHYTEISDVIGINVVGVRSSVKSIVQLTQKLDDASLKKFLEDNKSAIDADRFWITFATRKKIGGRWLFPKVIRGLIYCKPSQLIEINSHDNVIRVKGIGLSSIGPYQLITEHRNPILEVKQLELDLFDVTWSEVNLSQTGKLTAIVDKTMNLDTDTKKMLMFKGLEIVPKQKGFEVET